MKYLAGSALQKVLAAIVAAVMSFSVITPAISNIKSNQKPTGIVQTVKKVDGKIVAVTPEVKATEEETAPEAQEEETTAPEAQEEETTAPEAQEEETTAPEENSDSEPIAQWDVSATDEDDVQMYYYADDSFLDTIAGAVKALFVPMTALAAEEEGYTGGTLYVDGTGSTESFVFLNLIKDSKAFLRGYENWAIDNGLAEEELFFYKDDIDAEGCIRCEDMITAAQARNLSKIDGKVDYDYMLLNYYPTFIMEMVLDVEDFWDTYAFFTPEKIVLDGEIDTISFATFAYLTSVKEIEILGTVRVIGCTAFAVTGLTSIVIPEGTQVIGETAFVNCRQLTEITLPEGLQEIGRWCFTEIQTGSVIYVPDATVAFLLIDTDDVMNAASADGNAQQLTENYNSSRTEICFAQ